METEDNHNVRPVQDNPFNNDAARIQTPMRLIRVPLPQFQTPETLAKPGQTAVLAPWYVAQGP